MPTELGLAAHLLPIGHGEAALGEHLFVRDRFVVLAPPVGVGDGFGGAERVAVFIQKHFEKIAHSAELRWWQEIDERVSPLAFLLKIE